MIALADQSTMPEWPWWAWLLLAAALLVLWARSGHREAPKMQAPLEFWPTCETTGCHYRARTTVQSFTGPTLVCRGCADEGIAHGWFTAA